MSTVGIIMGSDSDLPVMSEAAKSLEELGIDYEILIVSAHRTPEKMFDYAKTARSRGLKIIIAGAGGSAHLPGMVAAITDLPVIGVPVKSKTLNGVDSLYSIVQMPPGIPVATVAIDGAKNAGLLAGQIIGAFDDEIAAKVQGYRESLKNMVEEKSERLEQIGYAKYLS
ncbi:MAG: 5-(carboxyamino)imidazole ribonucleotide mutase [Defluviitaleaceae bacterium]|nr:5-(carboxyamino)imidazole ribonucleotide mutase [Defluviitaleaceae bacterium]